MQKNKIQVEVAYASKNKQQILSLEVYSSDNIEKIIEASGILQIFPEIDLTRQKIGVFSKVKQLSDTVQDGDRIEIYRPLLIDPKEARHLRKKSKGST